MSKNLLSIVLGIVLGALVCYTSYPYIDQMADDIVNPIVDQKKEVIDKVVQPEYPVGTFEHEHKRTI